MAFPDFGEDLVDGSRPDERARFVVPVFDIPRDGVNEFFHAADREALQLALAQLAEEALDQIEPGGRGRQEVEMDARMPVQPRLHLRVLVSGVVVQDEVEVELGI